ncbi:TIGR00730 family Rossman fold protein [Aliidiomarina quisquiliarum]|uniref:LOG family protein n=1 Tax=Aliidiomarina quisquiliarum TaxID=2938947 RepID=UPI00208E19FB|nr:TIGR00730 family Rossman fold protein [Aliidiomarina quisquiliarum]MCO4322155.1 TIGR00730 family Rossman fold protein [Aliidiomarina quisquiliarum]
MQTTDMTWRLLSILESPTYRLAEADMELLNHADLRPIRLQLELLKPELVLRQEHIHSTVVVFGSARVLDTDSADKEYANKATQSRAKPNNTGLKQELSLATKRVEQARYYEQARQFAKLISARFQQEKRNDFVVVTGGGPGIMEAANRGAYEAGARSIGLTITLPNEENPNPYISPELAFRFHYFALRKMHFLIKAKGLVTFPGGFGTLDELFEVLTLIQTGKMPRIPIVLVGQAFWQRAIDFDYLVAEGYISASDLNLFSYVDDAASAMAELERFYQNNKKGDL